jgi:hypothetical protein
MPEKPPAKPFSRYIVLIPHRDAERILSEYRAALFGKGFLGAYSFPPVAPLAEVSRSINRSDLKKLAGNIRNLTKVKDGKITSDCLTQAVYLEKISFFGPALSLHIEESLFPETVRLHIFRVFSPTVLCAALLDSESNPTSANFSMENTPPIEAPTLSFRAAALANLSIRSLGEGGPSYSYEWRISIPVWLPAYKKEALVKQQNGNPNSCAENLRK